MGTSRAPSKRQQGPSLTETAVKPGMLSAPGHPRDDQAEEGPLTPGPSKQAPSDAQRHWTPQPRRLSKGVPSIPSSLLFYLKPALRGNRELQSNLSAGQDAGFLRVG